MAPAAAPVGRLAEHMRLSDEELAGLTQDELETRNAELDELKLLVQGEKARIQSAITGIIRTEDASRQPHELDQLVATGPLTTDAIVRAADIAGITPEQADAAINAILSQRSAETNAGRSEAL